MRWFGKISLIDAIGAYTELIMILGLILTLKMIGALEFRGHKFVDLMLEVFRIN